MANRKRCETLMAAKDIEIDEHVRSEFQYETLERTLHKLETHIESLTDLLTKERQTSAQLELRLFRLSKRLDEYNNASTRLVDFVRSNIETRVSKQCYEELQKLLIELY